MAQRNFTSCTYLASPDYFLLPKLKFKFKKQRFNISEI